MKSKKIFALTISFLLLLFINGCDENESEIIYQIPPADGRVIGKVHGIIQDSYTRERIAGATILFVINGEYNSVVSDSIGYYFINNLGTGEYELTIIAGGNYSRSKRNIYIPSISEVAGPNPSLKDYEVSIVRDVELFKIDAGITGKVYRRNSENNLLEVSNISVFVRFFTGNVEPSVYSTVTDNEGNYVFDKSLPAAGSIIVYTLPFNVNGIEYDATAMSNINLTPGINVRADNMIANIATSNVLILSHPFGNLNFDPAANFEFVFSKSIDVSSVSIELRRNDSFGPQLSFADFWSANNTMLVIDPYVILRENTQYYLRIDGKAADGSPFVFTGNVRTSGEDPIRMIRTNLEIIDGIYTNSFPVDGNIELEFNVAVDTSNSSFALLENNPPFNNVEIDVTLLPDEKTIIISPEQNLNYDFSYRLLYNANSYSQTSTSGVIDFKTEKE